MAKAPTEIRSLARAHTELALRTLKGIAQNAKANHSARVSAAIALLDRGWGKPVQTVAGDRDSDPIQVITRVIRAKD